MFKYFYSSWLLLAVIFVPISIIGQISNNTNQYKKSMKFNTSISIDEAKIEFIKYFELDNQNTFVQYKSNRDSKNGMHTKYQQYYKGVKVEYGTMIVHSKNNNVISINGELYNPEGLNLISNLSPESALKEATLFVDAKDYLWNNTEAANNIQYKKPEGELIIFPVIENGNSTLKLAYKFDIYASKPISRGNVYIDAHNGSFLFNDPIIKHVHHKENENFNKSNEIVKFNKSSSTFLASGTDNTRYSGSRSITTKAESNGTFTLNDISRNVHTYNAENSPTNGTYQFTKVDFVDDDNIWTVSEYDNAARDNAALDAHWGALNVFDFWTLLGRNSIDDYGWCLCD